MAGEDFYVRYYVGHKGKFGHEFLEFEFRPDGKVRAAGSHQRLPAPSFAELQTRVANPVATLLLKCPFVRATSLKALQLDNRTMHPLLIVVVAVVGDGA